MSEKNIQLTTKFKMVDEISGKLSNMASKGQKVISEFDRLSGCINSFDNLSVSAQGFLDIASNMSSNVSLSMRDIKLSTDEAENSVGNIADALNTLDFNLDSVSESSENYDKSLTNTIESLNGLTEAGENLVGSFEDLIAAAEEAAQHVSDYGERSDKAGDKSKDFGEKSTNAIDSLAQMFVSTGIQEMSQNLLNSLIDCSNVAGQFEVSMAKVASIADTSKMPIDEISASIKELSSETGQSVEDISEATYQAISASVDTASAVDFVATANKLSAGGFTEAATAVDVLTTALNAYGLKGSEVVNVSDMLITTQNLGKTSVDEIASSVGKVIPIASAYNVEMDNLSASYALLTAGGIATAETGTYLKAILNELGDSGSAVAEVLTDKTGRSFAELMESGRSLGDVIEILGNSVHNNNMAFSELWSSSEAKVGALSLLGSGAEKFNGVLEEMRNSTGATEKAYSIMTDTTVYAQEKMSNAFQNLKIVVGDQLNPAFGELYNSLASIFGRVGEFLKKDPIFAAKVESLAIGIGVFAVAVGGASAAMAIFNALCKMNPFILITSTAIAATVAIGAFVEILYNQNEYNLLSSTSKNQCDQIRELNSEYEEACRLSDEHSEKAQNLSIELNRLTESYESQNITVENQDNQIQKLNAEYEEACRLSEENSEKAQNLKKEIDILTEAYESQKITLEKLLAVQKELTDSHNEWYSNYTGTAKELSKETAETAFLIDKLHKLSEVTNKTAADKEEMVAVILELNKRMPELTVSYDLATGSIDKSIKEIRDYVNAELEKDKKENQYTAYIKADLEVEDLRNGLDVLENEVKAFDSRSHIVDASRFLGTWRLMGEMLDMSDQIEAQRNAIRETEQVLYSCGAAWVEQERAAREAAETPVLYSEAVERTVTGVSESLDELAQKYDESYEAAKESLAGQHDLFEKIEVEAGISSSSMLSIWEQQKEVFDTYKENLDKLSSYKIDVKFLQELNDGSTESMGQVSQLVKELENLKKIKPEKVSEFVNKINEGYKDIIETRDNAAKSMIDIEEDLAGRLADMEKDLKNSIENMNMSKEAESAAKATISAYIQNIKSMTREAESAAAGIANATAAALATGKIHTVQEDSENRTGLTISAVPTVEHIAAKLVSGNANGTTNAEDIFIAGEEGPELIVGKAGSTVFPTKETDKIISALDTVKSVGFENYDMKKILSEAEEKPLRTEVPKSFETRTEQSNYNYNETKSEKRIILEINGSGSIGMGDSFDEERAVNFMYENIKPVLLNIFRTEKYEEGEASYVF